MAVSFLSRDQSFLKLAEEHWDVIIIGGGATGCGTALDAASRGLKTLLIEKGDFASGTSGKSTKLIHGGLRYLKNLEFSLVKEVGKERAILQKNARHLVYRDPMFLPVFEGGELGRTTTAVALWMYEWLAGVEPSERRKMLSVEETLRYLPLLEKKGLQGAAKYFEYRTDDARLTLSVANSAKDYGAVLLNYTPVEGFLYDNNSSVSGVVVKDSLSNTTYEVKAKCVVNAAGPWVDKIQALDTKSTFESKLKGSRGIHIVISSFNFPLKQAVYFDAIDGRMVFAIPREEKVYVGTTDIFYEGSLDAPNIPRKEMQYLIDCVKAKFDVKNLGIDHIESAWSGVRPLVLEKGKEAGKISRKDELFVSTSGLLTIAGGKLTGYRKMAERATDKICNLLGLKNTPCKTELMMLCGGNFASDTNFENFVNKQKVELMALLDIMSYEAELLVRRYGSKMEEVLSFIPKSTYYAQKYQVSKPLALQVLYAVEREMALTAEDVYVRRTSDFYFRIEALKKNYKAVIAMMADCLGRNSEWIKGQEGVFEDKLEQLFSDK